MAENLLEIPVHYIKFDNEFIPYQITIDAQKKIDWIYADIPTDLIDLKQEGKKGEKWYVLSKIGLIHI